MAALRPYNKRVTQDIIQDMEEDEDDDVLAPMPKRNLMSDFGRPSLLEPPVSNEHMKVFLRIRPFAREELDRNEDQGCLSVESDRMVVTNAPKDSHFYKNMTRGLSKTTTKYRFSHIFNENTTQKDFFNSTMLGYVKDFIDGQNCLVFSYGVTSSGKTYTIQGNPKDAGILPRALDVLFNSIYNRQWAGMDLKPKMFKDVARLSPEQEQDERKTKDMIMKLSLDADQDVMSLLGDDASDISVMTNTTTCSESSNISSLKDSLDGNETLFRELESRVREEGKVSVEEQGQVRFCVWVSFAEIYNEQIYDLLVPVPKKKNTRRPCLKLSEDKNGSPYIKGLKYVHVSTADEAYKLLTIGQRNLQTACTKLNHNSSRSHCIFNIKILRVVDKDNPHVARVSTLTLCDLAGSERYSKTQNTGERLKEAGNINTSLLTLGRCIETLRYNQSHKDQTKIIPFRESKLTRLFQNFFVGQGKAAMIVNVNPLASMFDETMHVFKFSAIASKVEVVQKPVFIKPKLPVAPSPAHIPRTSISWATPARETKISQAAAENLPVPDDDDDDDLDEEEEETVYTQENIDELLGIIDQLQKDLQEEVESKWRMEKIVRAEVCDEMMKQFAEIEEEHSERLRRREQHVEELAEARFQIQLEAERAKHREATAASYMMDGEDEWVSSVLLTREQLKVEERDATIKQLQAELEALKSKDADLETAQQKILSLEQTISEDSRCKEVLAEKVASLQQELAKKGEASVDLDQANLIENLTQQLQQAKQQMKEQEKEVGELNDMLTEAGETFEQKQAEISKLRDLNTEYERRMETQSEAIAVLERAAADSKVAMETADQSLSQREDCVASLQANIRDLEAEVTKYRNKARFFEEQLVDREKDTAHWKSLYERDVDEHSRNQDALIHGFNAEISNLKSQIFQFKAQLYGVVKSPSKSPGGSLKSPAKSPGGTMKSPGVKMKLFPMSPLNSPTTDVSTSVTSSVPKHSPDAQLTENASDTNNGQEKQAEGVMTEDKLQTELAEKQKTIDELQAKVKDLEPLMKDYFSTSKKLTDSERKVKDLDEKLDDKVSKILEMEGQIAGLEKTVEGLREQLSEAESKCEQLEEKGEEMETLNKELRNMIDQTSTQLVTKETELKVLSPKLEKLQKSAEGAASLKDLQAEIEDKTKEVVDLQMKMMKMKSRLYEKETALKDVSEKCNEFEFKNNEMEIENAELQRQLEEQKGQLEEERGKMSDLDTSRTGKVAALKQTGEELAVQSMEIQQCRRIIEEHKATMEAYRATIEQNKATIDKYEAEIEEHKAALEKKKVSIDEYKNNTDDLESALANKDLELIEQDKQLEEKTKEIASLKEQLKTVTELHGSDLNDEISKLRDNETQLQKEMANLTEKLAESQQKYTNMVKESEAQIRDNEEKVKDLNKDLVKLEKTMTDSDEKYSDRILELEAALKDKETELNNALQEVENMEQKYEDANKLLKQKEENLNNEIEINLNKALQEVENLEQKYEESTNLLKRKEEEIANKDKERCEMQSELEDKLDHIQHELEGVKCNARELAEQVEGLGNELKVKETEHAALQASYDELKASLEDESVNAKLSSAMLELAGLKSAVHTHRTLHHKVKGELEEALLTLENNRHELEHYKKQAAQVKDLETGLQCKEKELSDKCAEFEKMQGEIEKTAKELNSKSEQVKTLESEVVVLRESLQQKDDELKELNQDIRNSDREHELAYQRQDGKIERLERELNERKAELDRVDAEKVEQIEKLQKTLTETQLEMTERTADIDREQREKVERIKELENIVDEVKKELNAKLVELDKVKDEKLERIGELEKTIAGKTQTQEAEVEMLRQELKQVKCEKDSIDTDKQGGHEDRVFELEQEVKGKVEKVKQLEEEVDAFNSYLRQICDMIGCEVVANGNMLDTAVNDVCDKISELKQNSGEHQQRIELLNSELDVLRFEKNELDSKVEKLTKDLNDLRNEHYQKSGPDDCFSPTGGARKMRKEKIEAENALVEARYKLSMQENKIADLEKKMKNMQNERTDALVNTDAVPQIKVNALTVKLQGAEERNRELIEEVTQLQGEVGRLEAELREVRDVPVERELHRRSRASILQADARLSISSPNTKSELSKSREREQQMREQLCEMNVKTQEWLTKLADTESKLQQRTQELQHATDTVHRLEAAGSAAGREVDRQLQDCFDQTNELKLQILKREGEVETHACTIRSLQAQLDTQASLVKTFEKEREEEADTLQLFKDTLREQEEMLEEQSQIIASKEAELLQQETEYQELRDQYEALKGRSGAETEDSKSNLKLQVHNEQLAQQLKESKGRVGDLEKKLRKQEAEREKLSTVLRENNEELKAMECSITEARREVEELRSHGADKLAHIHSEELKREHTHQLHELNNKIRELQCENKEVVFKLKAGEQGLEKLTEEKHQLQHTLQEFRGERDKLVSGLEALMKKKDTEIKQLKDTIAQLKDKEIHITKSWQEEREKIAAGLQHLNEQTGTAGVKREPVTPHSPDQQQEIHLPTQPDLTNTPMIRRSPARQNSSRGRPARPVNPPKVPDAWQLVKTEVHDTPVNTEKFDNFKTPDVPPGVDVPSVNSTEIQTLDRSPGSTRRNSRVAKETPGSANQDSAKSKRGSSRRGKKRRSTDCLENLPPVPKRQSTASVADSSVVSESDDYSSHIQVDATPPVAAKTLRKTRKRNGSTQDLSKPVEEEPPKRPQRASKRTAKHRLLESFRESPMGKTSKRILDSIAETFSPKSPTRSPAKSPARSPTKSPLQEDQSENREEGKKSRRGRHRLYSEDAYISQPIEATGDFVISPDDVHQKVTRSLRSRRH